MTMNYSITRQLINLLWDLGLIHDEYVLESIYDSLSGREIQHIKKELERLNLILDEENNGR